MSSVINIKRNLVEYVTAVDCYSVIVMVGEGGCAHAPKSDVSFFSLREEFMKIVCIPWKTNLIHLRKGKVIPLSNQTHFYIEIGSCHRLSTLKSSIRVWLPR